jgi:hypothetical protein
VGISERYACRALEQPSSSQRFATQTSVQEEPIVGGTELTVRFGWLVTALPHRPDGMSVVGKCATEKAEWAIQAFNENAVVWQICSNKRATEVLRASGTGIGGSSFAVPLRFAHDCHLRFKNHHGHRATGGEPGKLFLTNILRSSWR